MTDLAKLVVRLEAESSKLRTELEKSNKRVDQFARNVGKSTDFAKKAFLGIAAGVSFASIIAGVRETVAELDRLGHTADRINATVEGLTALGYAAEHSGVSAGTLEMAMQRMGRRIAEAAKGAGEAKDAIKQLGLDAHELSKLTTDQQLLAIARAFEQVTSENERTRLAFKLFDAEGVALKQMLNLGEDAIRAELEPLKPAVEEGGYIPIPDHRLPPSVSYDNFLTYIRVFNEVFNGD